MPSPPPKTAPKAAAPAAAPAATRGTDPRPSALAHAVRLKRRPRRRKQGHPEHGWAMVRDAAGRLGLWQHLGGYVVQRAFALAIRKLVPRLASEARAEAVQGDALVVRVSSSAVASELTYVRDLLLAQVNAEVGRLRERLDTTSARALRPVARFLHRVGPVAELPDAAEWARPQRPRRRPPPRRPPQSPEDEAAVVAALSALGDGTLRDALGALYLSTRRGG